MDNYMLIIVICSSVLTLAMMFGLWAYLSTIKSMSNTIEQAFNAIYQAVDKLYKIGAKIEEE